MTTQKLNLIKRITPDMPVLPGFTIDDAETVGELCKNFWKYPIDFDYKGLDYVITFWSINKGWIDMSFQAFSKNTTEYILVFNDKEDYFIQLIQ